MYKQFQLVPTYQDMLLVPQYSDIQSRSEVSVQTTLGDDFILDLPIISSPMDTVTEEEMLVAMAEAGGLGIVHRYNTIDEQSKIIAATRWRSPGGPIGAAIGVTGDFLERAQEAVTSGANLICLDIAHGHHIRMKEALRLITATLPTDVLIMAGNVATLEGIDALADWGANAVRCNIGGGSICSTRVQTGHGMPGLGTIFECAKTSKDVTIIADGGIRTSGDMVKALAAGADAVMCGSFLSGTTETPGQVYPTSNGKFKEYRGMASRKAQIGWRGKSSSPEGVVSKVPYRGPVADILADARGGLASGLSYTGARTLTELRSKAKWITQTAAGAIESGTHIYEKN
jgi:IMP dehydrogenase